MSAGGANKLVKDEFPESTPMVKDEFPESNPMIKDEFPESIPVVKDEVPDGESVPADPEGRDNAKTELMLMAEHQGLPMESPIVTTANDCSSYPPALSRSLTHVDKDKRSVVWQDQLDPQLDSDTNDGKVLDTAHRGEPSKRPDKQPASLSVSVNIVSQADGACGGIVEGQFSDAESMEDGTQLSSTMLMSSSTAGSTEHGSSWDR